jgi:hypothetical protein
VNWQRLADNILAEFIDGAAGAWESMPDDARQQAQRAAEYIAEAHFNELLGVARTPIQEQTLKRAVANLNDLQWTARKRAGDAMIEASQRAIEKLLEASVAMLRKLIGI